MLIVEWISTELGGDLEETHIEGRDPTIPYP